MKPFTREPGTEMLLPGTSLLVKIFPTHAEKGGERIDFGVEGPVKKFIAISDLERNEIVISGVGAKGPFKFYLKGEEKGERSRLHLGCHKSQDWLLIKRREDIREFLPFWHRLGQNLPDAVVAEKIEEKSKLDAEKWLIEQFRVRFKGLGVSQDSDEHHYGLAFQGDPLAWLKGSSYWIEKLFIDEKENVVQLLPCLPPQLHAGRLLGAELHNMTVDLEWTKKTIRRVVLYPRKDLTISLATHPFLKYCRVNGKKVEINRKINLTSCVKLIIDCFH